MQNYDHAIEKARHLAQTPEGKQLIEALRQMGGSDLEHAVGSAASGDFSKVQQQLTQLLQDPQARKLLESMEW